MYYFGPWKDPHAALAKYLAVKDDRHAGRTPRPEPGDLTLKDLANAFLNAKQELVDSGELSPRTWDGYKSACDFLVKRLGKKRFVADLGPDDFAIVRTKLAHRMDRAGWELPSSAFGVPANTRSTPASSISRSVTGRTSSGRARRCCGCTRPSRDGSCSQRRKSAR
jgi:hypothetical protein